MKGQKRISNDQKERSQTCRQSFRRHQVQNLLRRSIPHERLHQRLHHPIANPPLPPCHFDSEYSRSVASGVSRSTACSWVARSRIAQLSAGVCKSYLVIQRYMQCYLALWSCYLALCMQSKWHLTRYVVCISVMQCYVALLPTAMYRCFVCYYNSLGCSLSVNVIQFNVI